MKYVGIEFYNGVNNTFVKGCLKVPDEFSTYWQIGFRKYLVDEYKVKGDINIYPLNVTTLTPEKMGNDISGYKDMRSDFVKAIQSLKYFPNNSNNDHVRRQWASLDQTSPGYIYK